MRLFVLVVPKSINFFNRIDCDQVLLLCPVENLTGIRPMVLLRSFSKRHIIQPLLELRTCNFGQTYASETIPQFHEGFFHGFQSPRSAFTYCYLLFKIFLEFGDELM